jgi:hypothetical protein
LEGSWIWFEKGGVPWNFEPLSAGDHIHLRVRGKGGERPQNPNRVLLRIESVRTEITVDEAEQRILDTLSDPMEIWEIKVKGEDWSGKDIQGGDVVEIVNPRPTVASIRSGESIQIWLGRAGRLEPKWVRQGLRIEENAGDLAANMGLQNPRDWRLFWFEGEEIAGATDIQYGSRCELRYRFKIAKGGGIDRKVWDVFPRENTSAELLWKTIVEYAGVGKGDWILTNAEGEEIRPQSCVS